jgi:outer membrane protein
MRNLISSISIAFALLTSNLALGEDLMEVYEQALRNDPGIREAEANMMATFERKPQARAQLLPQLNASGTWENRNDETESFGLSSFLEGGGGATSITETDTDNWNVRLNLSQSIFDKDKWVQLKKADKEVAQGQADYETARQELITRVAEAYFNVLAAQDTLVAVQDAKNAFGRQLEQSERRFEVGLIAITDVKESQAAYDNAVATELDAKRSLANNKEALREITGNYPEGLAEPEEGFPLLPPDPEVEQDWVDVAMQRNFALDSAKLGADITRQNVRSARSGHLPTLDLNGSIGTGENDGTRTDLLDGAETPNISERDSYNIGLQLNIPIYSGGGVSSDVQETVYLHRASRENYEKVARQTERETRDAYFGVISDISRVQALRRSVESNQTALEATEAGYNVGTRTTVDVLDAQRELAQAQSDYARSKYDYLFNVLKLKQAAGTLNAADIEDLNKLFVVDTELKDTTPTLESETTDPIARAD